MHRRRGTSFLNLALYLVERWLGPEVARAASKMFLVDLNKASQSTYAIFSSQKGHADREILRAQDLLEKELAQSPSIDQLSRRLAMSRRTFVRRFTRATGNSPLQYLQRLKVEAAKRALESGDRSVEEIARESGYGDLPAFRRIFVRLTGLTPVDYRRRYGPLAVPTLVARRVRAGRSPAAARMAKRPALPRRPRR